MIRSAIQGLAPLAADKAAAAAKIAGGAALRPSSALARDAASRPLTAGPATPTQTGGRALGGATPRRLPTAVAPSLWM